MVSSTFLVDKSVSSFHLVIVLVVVLAVVLAALAVNLDSNLDAVGASSAAAHWVLESAVPLLAGKVKQPDALVLQAQNSGDHSGNCSGMRKTHWLHLLHVAVGKRLRLASECSACWDNPDGQLPVSMVGELLSHRLPSAWPDRLGWWAMRLTRTSAAPSRKSASVDVEDLAGPG